MKLYEQQAAFARDIAKLITFINDTGMTCTLGEAYRTPEQAAIYAQQGKGIKDSLHCHRLALDLNLFDLKGNYLANTESYTSAGIYWETLNPQFNRWGGRFSPRVDGNHFERREEHG